MSKRQLIFHRSLFIILAAGMFSLPAFADEESGGADSAVAEKEPKTLTIGSDAPSLDVEHWYSLGGEHEFAEVTEFEDGKIYIVEFWATWCGPCISSMPHLVETQERHAKDGVQIVSISDEDQATVEKFLRRPVRQRGKKKEGDDEAKKQSYAELTDAYCLTSDPDRSAHDDYMKAAAQNGIPTSFIVGKSGLIEWIGHPMSIDKPLQAVVDNEWDREVFGREFKEKQVFALMLRKVRTLVRGNEFDEALELLDEAKGKVTGRNRQMADAYFDRYYMQKLQYMAKNGEAEEALKSVEADIEKASDAKQLQLKKIRVELLMTSDRGEDAAKALTELIPEMEARSLNELAWSIYERSAAKKGEIDPKLLAVATDAAEMAVEKLSEKTPALDTLAHLVYLQGDIERAVEIQAEAVKVSEREWPEVKAFLKKLEKEIADAQDETEKQKEGEEQNEDE